MSRCHSLGIRWVLARRPMKDSGEYQFGMSGNQNSESHSEMPLQSKDAPEIHGAQENVSTGLDRPGDTAAFPSLPRRSSAVPYLHPSTSIPSQSHYPLLSINPTDFLFPGQVLRSYHHLPCTISRTQYTPSRARGPSKQGVSHGHDSPCVIAHRTPLNMS